MEMDRDGVEFAMMRKRVAFAGKDVLEVGCGDGRASAMLAPLVGSLVAIDPDLVRLERAKATVPGAEFRAGTGESLEFPDGSFDVVAFTFSLHHQDPERALAEARRVLRPGGMVLVVEPSRDGDMHQLFSLFRYEDPEIEGALAAMRASGLEIVSQDVFDIQYSFQGPDDLYDYFFVHYGTVREPTRMKEIDRVLGEKKNDLPILLVETVNMFLLKKI